MAEIICSKCGNGNPDFFDVCQFCQSPLPQKGSFHTGDNPEKVDTGELEPILPDWLRDARQQNRKDITNQETVKSPQPKPEFRSGEPPDLLAGLMSQPDTDDEDIPDWLAGITPKDEAVQSALSSPAKEDDEPSSFFAQFSHQDQVPAFQGFENDLNESPAQDNFASQTPFTLDASSSNDSGIPVFGDIETSQKFNSQQKTNEDLSWLKDIENSSKPKAEATSTPDSSFAFSSSGDDLSWLNNLGGQPGLAEPSAEPALADSELSWMKNLGGDFASDASTKASEQEDLSWLNALGGQSVPVDSVPVEVTGSQEDLSWLNNLGGNSDSVMDKLPSQPTTSQEDLDWLSNLGGSSNPEIEDSVQSESPQLDDMGWLNNLGGAPVEDEPIASQSDLNWSDSFKDQQQTSSTSPFIPSGGFDQMNDQAQSSTPDWLKDAAGTSISNSFDGDASLLGEPIVSPSSDFNFSPDTAPLANASDVDALFDIDMTNLTPDMSDTRTVETEQSILSDDSLAPVELPSWVQAMRPVESALGAGTSDLDDQVTEQEGPLAGIQGVIPTAPIGSALRPKAMSVKLQVSDEQTAGAALLEQIITGESTAHAYKSHIKSKPQRILRWTLTAVFFILTTLVLGLDLKSMPVSASAVFNEFSNIIATIPQASKILVVVDYDPALAGELEVVAGPVLDQLASKQSSFVFLSMSPNGSGLVERLMNNSGIKPYFDQSGAQYSNMGFLPGGQSGVAGFISQPASVFPAMQGGAFADFSAVMVLTDNAETGRDWIEQYQIAEIREPSLSAKPFILVTSAIAGPMLRPYLSSGQVDVMVNGLTDAAQFEYVNGSRPGSALAYWDAFGIGLLMAVVFMVFGSGWNLVATFIAKRDHQEEE